MQRQEKPFLTKPAIVLISLLCVIAGICLYGCQKKNAVIVKDARTESVPLKEQSLEKRKITYISNRDGIYGIYLMDEDGSNQQNLIDNSLLEGHLAGAFAWSPDGSKIAFKYGGRLIYNFYVMNSDGSQLKKLSNLSVSKKSSSWSPDGKKIIFQSESDIYTINADGSELNKLANIPLTQNIQPFWSPDGNKILFKSYSDKSISLHVMNVDGGQKKQFGSFSPVNQSWSPDGKKMVMQLYTDIRESDIYVINSNGSDLTRLTYSNAAEPCWSPDGKMIAFTSDGEIYIMNADGSGQKNITNTLASGNKSPSWSPNGKKITFVSIRDMDPEIYIINTDGSGQKRLTYNPGDDDMPCWRPN